MSKYQMKKLEMTEIFMYMYLYIKSDILFKRSRASAKGRNAKMLI